VYSLGINAAFHDSAACLVADGRIVAAVEEERLTGIKHGKRPVPFSAYELPFHAIDACLAAAGIELADVDRVGYSFDPEILTGSLSGHESIVLPLEPSAPGNQKSGETPWEQLFVAHIVNAPRHLRSGFPHHLQKRFLGVADDPGYVWRFLSHHLCHAASAFLPSPFEEAAVMTLDGRGERATTGYWLGSGMKLEAVDQVDFPNSLGMLYERVTEHLGFLHSSDEYKVMALASFGEPTYAARLRELVHRTSGGQYVVRPLPLAEWFGPARQRGEPFEQCHFDLAQSVQIVLEEVALGLASWLQEETGSRQLCLAGGVALNCVMNSAIRDAGIFDDIWVQPAAGDAGTALGAALLLDAEGGSRSRAPMDDAYLGPEFSPNEIECVLRHAKLRYERPPDLIKPVVEALCRDEVVGWFQGRMEFGPRALGARSILASPLHAEMQARLNEIKDREDFRPVAPAVLEEEMEDWFAPQGPSPFMLFVHDVLPDRADRIPAVRHVDGTARIQTVRRDQNPLYHDLLSAFAARTGVPVLVNTSFNTQGKPIVCMPRDALECFFSSPLDVLAMGPFLIRKEWV